MSMLFEVKEDSRFYCFAAGVDMRKGIQGLYALIRSGSNLDALSGDVFVFIGSNLKSIKVLQWHRNGFLLSHKRLEVGRFSLLQTQSDESFVELKSPELRKMISRIRVRSAMSEIKQKAILNL